MDGHERELRYQTICLLILAGLAIAGALYVALLDPEAGARTVILVLAIPGSIQFAPENVIEPRVISAPRSTCIP